MMLAERVAVVLNREQNPGRQRKPMSHDERLDRGPDRARVEELGTPEEKAEPDVFVGREDLIEAVERNCRSAMKAMLKDRDARKDALGMTFLVQGAPGAGKTTLLRHLKRRWTELGRVGPIVLAVHESDLKNTSILVRKIASAVSSKWLRTLRRVLDRFGVEVKVPGAGSARIGQGSKNDALGDFDLLAKAIPPEKWKRPVCIMVDEIQNITGEHAVCIRKLHEGWHGLPIVPIYAGLADSYSVLEKKGFTRMKIANVRTIGALAADECASYVEQMLDRCRIAYTATQLECIAGGIAERSEGWPQHLNTETAALFWGLDKAGCDLGRVDFDAVKRQSAIYREKSYWARQSPEMLDSSSLVAAVMDAIPEDGMQPSQVLDAIKGTARTDAGTAWRLPKGMDADMFRDHLVHRGALQLNRDNKLSCPIPSLRTWLIDQGSPNNTR